MNVEIDRTRVPMITGAGSQPLSAVQLSQTVTECRGETWVLQKSIRLNNLYSKKTQTQSKGNEMDGERSHSGDRPEF